MKLVFRLLEVSNKFLDRLAIGFEFLATISLLLMLAGTSATILLRPFGISFYWLWPWTIVLFAWMSFFGFFAIVKRKRDILVDFLIVRVSPFMQTGLRVFSNVVTAGVMATLALQMPEILDLQRGPIDGAVLPWGRELQRVFLIVPFVFTAVLTVLACGVDIGLAISGRDPKGNKNQEVALV